MTLYFNLILMITVLVIWIILIILKNLKFNLAGVQFLQGDHPMKRYNLTFDFIKPENLTKAELIDKFKKELKKNLEHEDKKKSILDKIKIYFAQISNLINSIKEILLKLTFLTVMIKIIRKYSLLRRIWQMYIAILSSIVAIFTIDNWAYQTLIDCIYEIKGISIVIVDYLSNTKFYNYLTDLFSRKEELINTKVDAKVSENIKSSKGNVSYDPKDHKYSEELEEFNKRQNVRKRKLAELLKNEVPEETLSNEIENRKSSLIKYIVIGTTIIVITSFGYVYWEDVKNYSNIIYLWVIGLWSRPNNDPRDPTGGSTSSNNTINPTILDIELEDETIPSIPISKGKGKEKGVLSSPSLEDLNERVLDSWNSESNSPKSDDSNNTIKPLIYNVTTNPLKEVVRETSNIEHSGKNLGRLIEDSKWGDETHLHSSSNIPTIESWKNELESSTKLTIDYVEKYFPKSDLDNNFDTIKSLIKEVELANMNFTKQAVDSHSPAEVLSTKLKIARNTEKWVNEMLQKLNNLD